MNSNDSVAQPPDDDQRPPPAESAISFAPSYTPLVVFFLVSTLALPVLFLVADSVLPRTPLWNRLFTAIAITSVAMFAWGVLRWEGVSLHDVGLDRERAVVGIGLVVAIWLVINVASVLLLVATGDRVALGLPSSPTNGLPVGAPAGQVLGAAITLWVFVGIAEEFAFRGYFQNKVVAMLGGGTDRIRVAGGILGSAVLFALWHVPQMLIVRDIPAQALLLSLVAITLYTLVLGTLYELTRNVVFVGVLHGTFDLNPFFVVTETGQPLTDLSLLVYPLALVAVVWYRRWAKRERSADFRPQIAGAPSD